MNIFTTAAIMFAGVKFGGCIDLSWWWILVPLVVLPFTSFLITCELENRSKEK